MKIIIKTITCLVLFTMLWWIPQTASAQSLLITFKNHSSVSVKMDNSFCISFSGDDIVFGNAKGEHVYPKSSIASITLGGKYGDVNYDEIIDVADIALLIDLMSGAEIKDMPRQKLVAVDLALPSQRKWASANIGAEKENDYGLFFAWGDTEGYIDNTEDGHVFDWANYKWMTEGRNSWEYIKKYQYPSIDGEGAWFDFGTFTGDGLCSLLPEDDAATVNLGEEWQMPTAAEVDELIRYTNQEWTQIEGIWGCKFTSNNGNYIFLPAAGYREYDFISYVNETTGNPYGKYWTKDLNEHKTSSAKTLCIDKDGNNNGIAEIQFLTRNHGLNIRPVYAK